MSKRVNIILSEQEEKNLSVLLSKYGGKASSYFRILLKESYEKEFGGYKSEKVLNIHRKAGLISELTPEQICEQNTGTVTTKDGIKVCVLPIGGGSSYSVPLSDSKRIPDVARQYGII